MSALFLALAASAAGAALGGAAGLLARRLVGGWTVPCRPRERDAYERRIADLNASLDAMREALDDCELRLLMREEELDALDEDRRDGNVRYRAGRSPEPWSRCYILVAPATGDVIGVMSEHGGNRVRRRS